MNGSATPRLLAATALCAGCLGLASCGGNDEGSTSAPTTVQRRSIELELVIGDVVPRSGAKQPFGPPEQKAANFAVAEINDAISKADADHVVEIAHAQVGRSPASSDNGPDVLGGTECVVGPPTAPEVARPSGGALAILTTPADGRSTRARKGSSVAELTGAATPPDEADGDSEAAFAGALSSFSPKEVPGSPRDARFFDATVLCYLAAVGAGATDPRRMARSLAELDRPGGEPVTWEQLPDAIEALERGTQIDYIGASGALRIVWRQGG